MQISSRTPEGFHNRCPVCGKKVCIEPSTFPTRDAPCPTCGHLLSFVSSEPDQFAVESSNVATLSHGFVSRKTAPFDDVAQQDEQFDCYTRVIWVLVATITSTIVALNDQLISSTTLCLAATLIFGQLILPEVYRLLGKLKFLRKDDSIYSFYLACMLGWALVPGLQIGLIWGASIPLQNEIDISSLHGALVGLVLFPIYSAVLGLLIAVVGNSICWMLTGKSLSEH